MSGMNGTRHSRSLAFMWHYKDDAEEQDEEEEEEHKDEDKDSTHAIFIADVYETKTDQPGRMRGRTRSPLEAGRYQPKEAEYEGEDEDTVRGKQPGSRTPAWKIRSHGKTDDRDAECREGE